jgi:ABC-type sugar transport system permease subunit
MKRRIDDVWRGATLLVVLLGLAFLIGPLVVAVLMSFDARSYLGPFPPPGLSLKWYQAFFANESFVSGPPLGETTEKGLYVDLSATFSQACRSSSAGHSRSASRCGRRRPATATGPQAPRQPLELQ